MYGGGDGAQKIPGTRKQCFSSVPVKKNKSHSWILRTRLRDTQGPGHLQFPCQSGSGFQHRAGIRRHRVPGGGWKSRDRRRTRHVGTTRRGATPRGGGDCDEAAPTHPSSISRVGHDDRSKRHLSPFEPVSSLLGEQRRCK